jgi:hypothetical protein
MFDYFKLTEEELLQGAKRTYEFLDENHERLGLPSPALTLREPLDEFETALAAAKDKNTGVAATVRKDAAKETMMGAFRDYGNENLAYNRGVTDEDRARAGWHIRKKTSSHMPRPADEPIVYTDTRNEREVWISFRANGARKQGKPKNIGACVIRWVISDHEPTSLAELIHVETVTKSPFILKFNDSDRGKRLYFVACWQINRGRVEGPMTAIRMVIIP